MALLAWRAGSRLSGGLVIGLIYPQSPQGSSSSAHHPTALLSSVCAFVFVRVYGHSQQKPQHVSACQPPRNETPKTVEAVMLALTWFIAALWSSSALLLLSPTTAGSAQSRTYGAYKHSCWSGNSLSTTTSERRLHTISSLALFPLTFGWVGPFQLCLCFGAAGMTHKLNLFLAYRRNIYIKKYTFYM